MKRYALMAGKIYIGVCIAQFAVGLVMGTIYATGGL